MPRLFSQFLHLDVLLGIEELLKDQVRVDSSGDAHAYLDKVLQVGSHVCRRESRTPDWMHGRRDRWKVWEEDLAMRAPLKDGPMASSCMKIHFGLELVHRVPGYRSLGRPRECVCRLTRRYSR